MSKAKNVKKKGLSTASDTKLMGVKIESDVRHSLDTETPVTNFSSELSSKNITSKCEAASCYESVSSCNLARDSSADNVSHYMKNAILEEVLNEKKAALLQSPEIIKLLREEQLKQQQKK